MSYENWQNLALYSEEICLNRKEELELLDQKYEKMRKELEELKQDVLTEQINNKVDLLREEVKLFAVGLSMIHSDVCRIMVAVGVIK